MSAGVSTRTQADGRQSSVATKFERALLLRCPRCGGRAVLRSWLKLKDQCPQVFPFSRTLWLAWDLSFRPVEPGDAVGRTS
jgi:hypothetical protein